ncbi:MAG: DNA replication/repair protein RecF [Porticoccaceae bacterium]
MPLTKLDVYGLRNLKSVQLSLSVGVNLFYGKNGSGKSSLLEAIFLLGRGRSFRSRLLTPVINNDESQCTVFGLQAHGGRDIPIGVTRTRQGSGVFKINGQPVTTASSLAETLPLQLINQDAFNLLEGSPLYRRRFIDWGVFHVEQGYQQSFQKFQRTLKQRNSLLRHDRMDEHILASWDREYVDSAADMTQRRNRYLEDLLPIVKDVLARLTAALPDVEYSLYPGWDEEKSLAVVLEADRRRDVQYKTTHHGPHRADLRIRYGKHPAAEVLSRGQLKILAIAMLIAQGFLFHARTGRHCIYLIDDLVAELDLERRTHVAKLLIELGGQVIITGVRKEDLVSLWPETETLKLFHVEQGQIAEERLNPGI